MLTIVPVRRFKTRFDLNPAVSCGNLILGSAHSIMGNISDSLLITAREHFYSLRLLEAYAIFRRFFDRIPFQPEKRHAEYIGMFARVLAELGKTGELKFYMGELERWYQRSREPSISYQLAIVYSYLPEPRTEAAKRIFEALMTDPAAGDYRLKARMMLADYYDMKGDLAACRQLVFGVALEGISDPTLQLMYRVWRSKILRDEGRLDEAELGLNQILDRTTIETNWYVYWWTRLILARVFVLRKKRREALAIVADVEEFLRTKRCRSLENHLESFRQFIDSHGDRKRRSVSIDSSHNEEV